MSLIGAVIKRRIPLPWKLLSEARSVDAGGTVGEAGTRVGVAGEGTCKKLLEDIGS